MSEEIPAIDLVHVYWNEEAREYRLAIVADCKTQVFSFKGRGKVFGLASNAMATLAQDRDAAP